MYRVAILVIFFIAAAFSAIVPIREQTKLSLTDWNTYRYYEPNGPGTYAFGYDIDESDKNNVQFRQEERLKNGTVVGSYGYQSPDGSFHIVRYISDNLGYRATIERKLGLAKTLIPPY